MLQALIVLIFVLATAVAVYAYNEGYLDPYIEKIGIFFKMKAAAEKKNMQAQGMKAGQDFVDSQLSGVQQAEEVKLGMGAIGA